MHQVQPGNLAKESSSKVFNSSSSCAGRSIFWRGIAQVRLEDCSKQLATHTWVCTPKHWKHDRVCNLTRATLPAIPATLQLLLCFLIRWPAEGFFPSSPINPFRIPNSPINPGPAQKLPEDGLPVTEEPPLHERCRCPLQTPPCANYTTRWDSVATMLCAVTDGGLEDPQGLIVVKQHMWP